MSEHSSRCLVNAWARVLLVVALAGCNRTEPSTTASAEPELLPVAVVDRAGFDAVLAELRGKVVLVDCWATWCAPCLEQLPHTGEMVQRHRADDFAAVTLCLDDPDKLQQIRQLLRRVDSTAVVHLVSQFGSGTKSADVFDIPPAGHCRTTSSTTEKENFDAPSHSIPPPKGNSPPPTSTRRSPNCWPSDRHFGG